MIGDLENPPKLLLIDSIQTMSVDTELSSFSAGSVSQIKESTAALVRFAKDSGNILSTQLIYRQYITQLFF
jgi:predicted ATP-dependent serine protease